MPTAGRTSQAGTALHLAVREPERLRGLVANELPGFLGKADFRCTEDGSPGLLHCAVLAGSVESARILLDAGADIDEQDSLGRTPLMHASTEGSLELAQFLVKRGAALDLRDKDGQNCAHCAFCMEHLELGNWLVTETSVDSTAVDADGRTPLDWRALHLGDGDGDDDDDDDDRSNGPEAKQAGSDSEEEEESKVERERVGLFDDDAREVAEAKLADAKRESSAFVINGEEHNFAAGTGLRATRWLRKSTDDDIICCDE